MFKYLGSFSGRNDKITPHKEKHHLPAPCYEGGSATWAFIPSDLFASQTHRGCSAHTEEVHRKPLALINRLLLTVCNTLNPVSSSERKTKTSPGYNKRSTSTGMTFLTHVFINYFFKKELPDQHPCRCDFSEEDRGDKPENQVLCADHVRINTLHLTCE